MVCKKADISGYNDDDNDNNDDDNDDNSGCKKMIIMIIMISLRGREACQYSRSRRPRKRAKSKFKGWNSHVRRELQR